MRMMADRALIAVRCAAALFLAWHITFNDPLCRVALCVLISASMIQDDMRRAAKRQVQADTLRRRMEDQ
jgi:hypothetical protein